MQYGVTPKALANSSPGFERSREPWDINQKKSDQTLKGLAGWRTLSGLIGWRTLSGLMNIPCPDPRVVASLQPWAEISERLRRNSLTFQTDALLCISYFVPVKTDSYPPVFIVKQSHPSHTVNDHDF